MGEWIDTAWVKAPVDAVVEGLVGVIAATGRAQIPMPAPRTREHMNPMQHDADAHRWAIAVRAGAPGWSIIKTAPMDLLALPEIGAPRLAWLCAHLKAHGLHHSVMDGSADRLVECDAAGRVSRWGMWGMSGSGLPGGWTLAELG